ncbi:MAG TPA: ATP-binding protein [Polyangiaceae bacterium]|nr:ATP-binding protein [Polyangiaceae bacterium]
MGQHVHELLHVAAATLFIVVAVSALLEYRNLRERVVLTFAAACSCAAIYASHVAISHGLPKAGAFWIPWTSLGLSVTFGATFFYLLTMRAFVGVRGKLFGGALVVQLGITGVTLSDALLYAITRRSFMFTPVARPQLSAGQLELGEGAYSLLPTASIVGALFMLSYVFSVGYLLTHLIRTRSRDALVYAGLVFNSAIVVNDTLVAFSVFGGWYLMAFSKAFETIRIHGDIRTRARERIERRLRQAEKMEAIGRVAGGIAHDFNNILQAVGGSVDLAGSTVPQEHPVNQELAFAREALDTGQRLVRQLLDVARAEQTKVEYVDVHAFLSQSTKLLSSLVSRETPLELVIEPQIGGVMIAPGQLTQVLMNLVINARDAMPNGGKIRISATTNSARRAEARNRTEIVISVIDQGSGMPAEVLEHVFEPFFTTKSEQGGSGLGLATLYSIVRKAGGHVEVESEVGRGTRFDVVLPRCEA